MVRRNGHLVTVSARPRYDANAKHVELGFGFGSRVAGTVYPSAGGAASASVSDMWFVTHTTVARSRGSSSPQERKQSHSVVGSYTVTQESFATSTTQALEVLALISLSLAVINLFPFLPLDGGHVFWALAEKVRGRRISFSVMERAGSSASR